MSKKQRGCVEGFSTEGTEFGVGNEWFLLRDEETGHASRMVGTMPMCRVDQKRRTHNTQSLETLGHSFVRTNEYIQIIFIGLDREPVNI
jgi:hypothetical protein